MDHIDFNTRIRPEPWNDRPTGGRNNQDGPFPEGLQCQPHGHTCSTPSTGEIAVTENLIRRYVYLFHWSLIVLLNVEKTNVRDSAVIRISDYQAVGIRISGDQE
jgi:hypothetical protein